jgi:tetraacyldisaccharide-1-P 4'-kinase
MKLVDRVRVPQEVVTREVGDETVMLHLANGTYYCVDPVGARIWQLLAEGRTLAQVCDTVMEEYEVQRAELERDVLDLVANLEKHGLIAPA